MLTFVPSDPDFEARTRAGFARQQWMVSLGAQLTRVAPGEVHIEFPFAAAWTQQHGYVHAGVITSVVDSACGFAAYTLMPARHGVLTVEYKVNFLRPATGESFIGVGKVVKPGRTLTICQGEAFAVEPGARTLIAVMQATMIALAPETPAPDTLAPDTMAS